MEKFRVAVLGIEKDGTTHLLHGTKDGLEDARLFAQKQERFIYDVCAYTHYVILDGDGVVVEIGP